MKNRYRRLFPLFLIFWAMLLIASCTGLTRDQKAEAGKSETQRLANPLYDWPQDHSDLEPDPSLTFGRFPNGFRYVIKQNQTPRDRVSMHLVIQAGSVQETDEQKGDAHFLEHMLFNGSEHFPPGELIKYFQRIGMDFGPDANAHTGFHETVYDVLLPKGDMESLEEGLLVMSDYAQKALLPETEVERERKVILAEKRQRDSASFRTFKASLQFELPEARITRRLPIGEQETIETADHSRLKDFYDTWYRPDRMVLVVVGDVSPETVTPLIEARFSDMKPRAPPRPEPEYGTVSHEGNRVFYHYENEAGSTEVAIEVLGAYEHEADSKAFRQRQALQNIGHQIVQNRLEDQIRKPGNPFTEASVGSGIYLRAFQYGVFSADCSPENWDKTLTSLERNLRTALISGFTPEELDRVKKDYLAGLDRNVNNAATRESSRLARQMIRHLNSDRVTLSPEQERDLLAPFIEGLTPEIVHGAFQKIWNKDHRLVMVTGNAEIAASDVQPNGGAEAVILSVFEQSFQTPEEAPEPEQRLAFPYLEPPGEAGKIAFRENIEDLGITRIRFDNGVHLNLKATDFQENEVMATLVFGPGRRSEPPDTPGLNILAESVINESGLGKMTALELEKALAGKNTTVRFNIDDGFFSLDGKTVTDEMELLIQLFYARLIDPGLREESYDLIMERFHQRYLALTRTVDGAMLMEGSRFLAGGDSRFGLPEWEVFSRLTTEDIRKWVFDDFSEAGLELSIVGDFNPDEVISICARYFGGLPSGREEIRTERSGQPQFPMGKQLSVKVDSRIPKGEVRVVFPTSDVWDIHRTRRLSLLGRVFSERMRVVIREKLGATYSPYAYNLPSRDYPDYGLFNAVVGVQPGDAESVITEIRAIAADLSENGITEEDLQLARKPTLTGIKDMMRKNQYWLGTVLRESSRHPEQLDWSRSILLDYATISRKEVSEQAKIWLKNEKAAVITIVPGLTETSQKTE